VIPGSRSSAWGAMLYPIIFSFEQRSRCPTESVWAADFDGRPNFLLQLPFFLAAIALETGLLGVACFEGASSL
jgi:hypothetical protein